MKYESPVTLPPYLMAFAIGDFEIETPTQPPSSGVPISVWHRPGVAGDYTGTLEELTRLMDTFEPLLGPYPFSSYSLVMLPSFSGGMENAGITFQSETGTAQPRLGGTLNAHEFGHQWFGDAVTVATWDDLWIKEGMATLLEYEASRPFEDRSQSGVLFGDRLVVLSGEAARDTALAPEDKYTTGPYDRGAWIFTQIRHLAGEQAFWSTLRDLVSKHAYGTLSTADVLAAFEPLLPKDAAARLAGAVNARALPSIHGGIAQGDFFEPGELTLHDPESVLIAPIEFEWHREDGTVETVTLVPEKPVILERKAPGDLLIIDPADVHPELWRFFDEDSYYEYGEYILPLTVPAAPAGVPAFSQVPGIQQYSTLYTSSPSSSWLQALPFTPDDWPSLQASLSGDSARATVLSVACDRAKLAHDLEEPGAEEQWPPVLTAMATSEPAYSGLLYAPRIGTCQSIVDPGALFEAEWTTLRSAPEDPSLTPERVQYLSAFSLPYESMVDTWMPAATDSYSIRIRLLAARRVRSSPNPDIDASKWRPAILQLLAGTDCMEVLRQVIPAASDFAGTSDAGAFLDQMRRILSSPAALLAHASAACGAYVLLFDEPTDWAAFADEIRELPVSRRARKILDDPSRCF
ncbi:MAG: M1 family aminopeptidase [Polyangiaceae bacterium]